MVSILWCASSRIWGRSRSPVARWTAGPTAWSIWSALLASGRTTLWRSARSPPAREHHLVFFPIVLFLLGRASGGVEALQRGAAQGREEEAREAGGQEVAGEGPGDEERGPGREVRASYELQGVEDAAGREYAHRVGAQGEEAGDEAHQQREREAE